MAQEDTTKIKLRANWAIGDSHIYEVTKVVKQMNSGLLTAYGGTQHLRRFEVIDSTQHSYKIKWSELDKSVVFEGLPKELYDKIPNGGLLDVIYTCDQFGVYQGIDNEQEILEFINSTVDTLIAQSPERERAETKRRIRLMTGLHTSIEDLENFSFEEIAILHSPLGLSLTPSDTLKREGIMHNSLFRGGTIKCEHSLFIKEIDRKKQIATLHQENHANKEILEKQCQSPLECKVKGHTTYKCDINTGMLTYIATVSELKQAYGNDTGSSLKMIMIRIKE